MNYRHAFHAGNFADCMKHALFLWLLRAMARKDTGFFVLDSHAGAGSYDLTAGEAERTGEWHAGIGRILATAPEALADYMALVLDLGLYPGSPAIARAVLRPQDRLAVVELHPEDARLLRRRFGRDGRAEVHERDGYEAIGALLPPPERRALVLIDPPFEARDEFLPLASALQAAIRRFPDAVLAAWYPIKHRAPVRAFFDDIAARGIPDVVAAELCLRAPLDAERLNGCGLVVVNPPYRFAEEWPPLLAALLGALGDGEVGEEERVIRITDE